MSEIIMLATTYITLMTVWGRVNDAISGISRMQDDLELARDDIIDTYNAVIEKPQDKKSQKQFPVGRWGAKQ